MGLDPIRRADTEEIKAIEGEAVSQDLSEEELLTIIRADERVFSGRFDALHKIGQRNEKYWAGDQIDKMKIAVGESDAFINKVLVAVETMASIITSATPLPWVVVNPRTKTTKKLSSKLERHLRDIWEFELNVQKKMVICLRNFYMWRFGVMKYFWNKETDEVDLKVVRPENIKFDLDATSIDESRYVVEDIWDQIDELKIKFPDKKEYLDGLVSDRGGMGERSKIKYQEYWGERFVNEGKRESFVCWKHRGEILGKETNPYFAKGKNHFKFPKKPYLILNSLNTGKSLVDDTSTIEQAIPIQDLVNVRKRQINTNAEFANGIRVVSASAMSGEEFGKLSGKTKKILLDGDVENVDNAFAVKTGRAFEAGIFEDMSDSKREIDNIFGTHDTTRGERSGSETARGRILLRDADFGRQDLTGRDYEQLAEDVYNGLLQLMYVFYKNPRPLVSDKEEAIPAEGFRREEGLVKAEDVEQVISRDELRKVRIKIIVKKGTTRPKDPEADREMAIMLKQTQNMNPLTFFELIGVDNPRKHARREFLWLSQPQALFPELLGDQLTEPVAIMHIKDINNGVRNAEDQVFEGELEQYAKHLSTHTAYLNGTEVDEDLASYPELAPEVQQIHRAHIEVETLKAQQMVQEQQAMQPVQAAQPVEEGQEPGPEELGQGLNNIAIT